MGNFVFREICVLGRMLVMFYHKWSSWKIRTLNKEDDFGLCPYRRNASVPNENTFSLLGDHVAIVKWHYHQLSVNCINDIYPNKRYGFVTMIWDTLALMWRGCTELRMFCTTRWTAKALVQHVLLGCRIWQLNCVALGHILVFSSK